MHTCNFLCSGKELKETERKEGGEIMKTLLTFGWYSVMTAEADSL